MSRVKEGDHLRLLLNGDTELEQWYSLKYLLSLKPRASIRFFFDGFRDYNEANPNIQWATNEWSAARANAKFRERLHDHQST